jgi:hypothetical protein
MTRKGRCKAGHDMEGLAQAGHDVERAGARPVDMEALAQAGHDAEGPLQGRP